MNSYEERRQEKIQRVLDRAATAGSEANVLWNRGNKMASVIPFGQPILVGHHSERGDRNYRNRIQNTFHKASKATDKAAYYAHKAEAMENNTAISSDDPDATVKLREKITKAEQTQEQMKVINTALKAKGGPKVETLHGLGVTDEQIAKLLTPDFAGRTGFPAYEITNHGANIRRMKERLASLEAKRADKETETTINGVRIVENVDENRCQMFFPGKPGEAVRTQLKSCGFRWSPTNGCWQRQRSSGATWNAERIAKEV